MVWSSPDRYSTIAGDENTLSGVDLEIFKVAGDGTRLEMIPAPSLLKSASARGTADTGSPVCDGT